MTGGLLVIDLGKSAGKSAGKRIAQAALDVAGWNAANPGHPKGHDGRWSDGAGSVLRGEEALKSVPAKMTRPPGGRGGNYAGAALDAPKGHGDVLALAEYEGLEYGAINSLLRGDYARPYETLKWHTPDEDAAARARHDKFVTEHKAENEPRVAEIDKTMGVSPLPQAIEVQRVVRHGRQIWGDEIWYGDTNTKGVEDFDEQDRLYARWTAGERPDLTGLSWPEQAYVSTTASDTFAAHHARHWHGDPGEGEPVIMTIRVPAGTGGIQLSEWGEVGEILLQRGLVMQVAKDHGVGSDGFRRLDIEVVRPNEN